MNILFVEDEVRVADFVRRGLKGEGWIVDHVKDGESALELIEQRAFDAIILDLMLPGMSGQDVCRKLRARGHVTPVLMLSALDAVDELVAGLRIGADDYMTKPFEFDELVARINALIRRENDYRGTPRSDVLAKDDLIFNRQSLIVTVDGTPVDLTTKERDILKLLMTNPDRVLTREHILNAAWGAQEDPLTNVVDVYVGRLRRKIGRYGDMIQTVRGLGYRFSG